MSLAGSRRWTPEETARFEIELCRGLANDKKAQRVYFAKLRVVQAARRGIGAGSYTTYTAPQDNIGAAAQVHAVAAARRALPLERALLAVRRLAQARLLRRAPRGRARPDPRGAAAAEAAGRVEIVVGLESFSLDVWRMRLAYVAATRGVNMRLIRAGAPRA